MKLFITGKHQCGKSTLLKKIAGQSGCEYSGLRSFVREENSSKSVFITRYETAGKAVLAGVRKNRQNIVSNTEAFDLYGVEFLSSRTPLVVIDEVGSLEQNAVKYISKIESLLKDPDIDVLGVLQEGAEGPLTELIKKYAEIRDISAT